MVNFDYIKERGLLLYKYVRGSQLYGLSRPESDIDYGGVYIEPLDVILGLDLGFPEQISDSTNDESWFSLKKYAELLKRSNPNVLESLYVPEDKIVYKHPIMDYILENRDKFVTKLCFYSFMGYAKTQIEKARNLKKKIVQPMEGPMLSVLEFIMYKCDEGSKPVITWLKNKGLMQEHCGLVKLDKMPCLYSMYYDWGAHFKELGINKWNDFKVYVEEGYSKYDPFVLSLLKYASLVSIYPLGVDDYSNYIREDELKKLYEHYEKPFKYKGLVNRGDTSNQVRLSSIPKGEQSIMEVSYNKDGYSHYCKQYNEYQDFEKHHNPERFNLAKKHSYDYKNMTHAFRLLKMGIEIAKGEGFKVDRTNIDRDFLLNIRMGGAEYEDLMKDLKSRDEEMKQAMLESTIPDRIDDKFLSNIIVKMRKEFYGL